MAAQEIYLTPRKIMEYLRLIEQKVKRMLFEIYIPNILPFNEETASKCAQEMFEFAGLHGYIALTHFKELAEGVGGQIALNSERIVHIDISKTYKGNANATMAILAHEICHKVLYINDLVLQDTLTNEILTDLTTIYIGFGRVILEGCITSDSNGQYCLGYLTKDTYRNTHLLVSAIYGKSNSGDSKYKTSDYFIEEAFKIWERFDDKEDVMGEIFIKRCNKYTLILKDIQRLEELLKYSKMRICHNLSSIEDNFLKQTGVSWDQFNNKLAAFSLIYEHCLWEKEIGTAELPQNLTLFKKAIENATYDLFIKYQDVEYFSFSNHVACPYCGTISIGKKRECSTFVEKCPNCKKLFVFDESSWNPTIRQREINEEKALQQKSFDLKVEKLAEEKVTDIRNNERERIVSEIKASIPKLLRPIFIKYIKKLLA